jgi:transposase
VEKVIRIGLDTSKEFFQLHGVGSSDRVVLKEKLRRGKVEAFFARLEPTVIGLEACGGSHHWARVLSGLGHEVRLVAPQHAKRYVKRGKNDAADAAAICEAMSRPDMTFVAPKSLEQQAGLMLIGVRNRLVRSRTRLGNAIRGHAAEFGLIAAKGVARIEPLLERIAQDAGVPELARRLFALEGKEYRRLERELSAVEDELMAWHKANECSRRLAEIPGIGPIGGTMLAVKAPEVKGFRSGRYFAAWIGMTPKDHSTAGKSRQGGITRAGDPALRSVLVVGAMAVIRQAKRNPERASPWLLKLLERKPKKLAAVALANKHARIAWKLIMTGERYDAEHHRPQAGVAAA